MKKQTVKQFAILFAFGLFLVSMSSCNRGYGCPTFSVQKVAAKTIQVAASAVLPN